MAAFNIVGVDFELRFGVDFRVAGEQQIVIGLVRVGAVGPFVDNRFAVPHTTGFSIEDAAIFLRAERWPDLVVDPRVIVNVLLVAGKIQPVENGAGIPALQFRYGFVACQGSAQVEAAMPDFSASCNWPQS